MAEENTHPEYDEVMNLYNILRQHGHEKDAKDVMTEIEGKYSKGTSAPPEEIKAGLESKLREHGIKIPKNTPNIQQQSELESKAKVHPATSVFERIGSLFSKPAVAASATALLLLYLGLPPVY